MSLKGFGKWERTHIFKRERGRCYWCRCKLNTGPPDDFCRDPRRFTVDHKKPLSKGGKTSYRNCVAACRHCNFTRPGGKRFPKSTLIAPVQSQYIAGLFPLVKKNGTKKQRIKWARRAGRKGGPARAASLSPQRRSEIARMGGLARSLALAKPCP